MNAKTKEALSRIKFRICTLMPQKLYWFPMGELMPVPAVTNQYSTFEQCLKSGAHVVEVLKRLGVVKKDAVTLQIGSGLGRIEAHLCRHVQRCYGLDISPSMVRKARRLISAPNVSFVCGDNRWLDSQENNYFDLIYSFLVFQHLPRPTMRSYLEQGLSKLKPGGALVFQLQIDEHGANPEPPASHPYGIRFYKRANVINMLRQIGFKEISTFDLDGQPDDGAAQTDVIFRALKPAS